MIEFVNLFEFALFYVNFYAVGEFLVVKKSSFLILYLPVELLTTFDKRLLKEKSRREYFFSGNKQNWIQTAENVLNEFVNLF